MYCLHKKSLYRRAVCATGQLAGDDGRQLMGRGTWADGAIVLAYRQGGGDGTVSPESREPRLGSDWGLSAPPLGPTLSCFLAAARRGGRCPRHAWLFLCRWWAAGRGGTRRRRRSTPTSCIHRQHTRALWLSSLVPLPLPLPLLSRPSTGRRRTLEQPRHAGSPPPQPR